MGRVVVVVAVVVKRGFIVACSDCVGFG